MTNKRKCTICQRNKAVYEYYTGRTQCIDCFKARQKGVKKPRVYADVTNGTVIKLAGELPNKLKALLAASTKPWTLEALADKFDCGPGKIRDALVQLGDTSTALHVTDEGISVARELEKAEPTVIDVSKHVGKEIAFGVTADNHLGSKYARTDVLNALYDIWADEGIQMVYQLGNMVDGEARFNRYDLVAHGIDGQVAYFVENWPQRRGIHTAFVTGDDHEGWWIQREGINIGKHMEQEATDAGRHDLHYLGHMEHDLLFSSVGGSAVMRLIHAGGGSAYATSYAPQKIVESYQGGEKPNILLIGHYHKAEYGYPREVHTLQAGCTQDQSPFMRKLKIQAHIGGWTVRMVQDAAGLIHKFQVTWHPFYDRAFYTKPWKYQWGRK